MVARAHERFAAERARTIGAGAEAALPNLVVIGGLKCGTTSLHHYLGLHPEIGMSRPKELNFFVAELNWELGEDWYANHFSAADTGPRRDLAPLHERAALLRRRGADTRDARRRGEGGLHGPRPDRPDALPLPPQRRRRLREPSRSSGPRRTRERLRPALPLRDAARAVPGAARAASGSRSSPARSFATSARRRCGGCSSSSASTQDFTSPQFSREWETGSGKGGGGFRFMDRAVRLPGLRALDRNFDRLPESLALGGRADRPRPRLRRGAEAGAAGGAREGGSWSASVPTSSGWRGSRAGASAGSTPVATDPLPV